MCSAPLKVGDLTPGDLPVENVSLDMYILRDQEIVITSNWVTGDETVTMDFPGCVQEINDRFSQTLILVKQALVLIDQIFTFVNMNSTLKFVAHSSQDLQRVFSTLGQIIEQESAFLKQLTSFKSILTTAKVFTDVTERVKRTAYTISCAQTL